MQPCNRSAVCKRRVPFEFEPSENRTLNLASDTNEAGADGGGREGAQAASVHGARWTRPAPWRSPGAAVRRSPHALRRKSATARACRAGACSQESERVWVCARGVSRVGRQRALTSRA